MRIDRRIRRALLRRLLPIPVAARHAEYSAICSADDDPSRPSPRLLDVALEAIQIARQIQPDGGGGLFGRPLPEHLNIWPGESYRLLAGLARAIRPALAVEVGTGGGAGTLCLRQAMEPGGRIVTFDIIPWRAMRENCLREEDFRGGGLVQEVADLSRPDVFQRFRPLLEEAGLIFLDGPKDGVMEQRFLDLLESVSFRAAPLILMDDIRVWNMLRIWRAIRRPKLDLTSFGHWSGTGLVDWSTLP